PPNVLRSVVDRMFIQAGIEPHVAAQTDVLSDMLAAVQAGVGATIVPLASVEELREDAGFFCQVIVPEVWMTACIVSSAETPLGATGEAVRDLILGFISKQLRESRDMGTALKSESSDE